MNRVQQRIFGPPDGDCFAACVASILELPIERVPNFHGDPITGEPKPGFRHWRDQWAGWLAPANLALVLTMAGSDIPAGFGIKSVKSPRFEGCGHAVVCWNGKVVWDPWPGAVIAETELLEWNWWYAITVIDPTRPVDITALPEVDARGYNTDGYGLPKIPIRSSRPGLTGRYDLLAEVPR